MVLKIHTNYQDYYTVFWLTNEANQFANNDKVLGTILSNRKWQNNVVTLNKNYINKIALT
jgi:hypothetical protein